MIGKPWTVRFYPKKKFAQKYPGTLGVCLGWKRQIRLPLRGLKEETVAHELTHAMLHEMCVTSTDSLRREELEEVFCEMWAKFGVDMLMLADQIWTEYQRRRA